MKPRMEYWRVAPGALKAMSSLEAYLRESGLDKPLLHRLLQVGPMTVGNCRYHAHSAHRCIAIAQASLDQRQRERAAIRGKR